VRYDLSCTRASQSHCIIEQNIPDDAKTTLSMWRSRNNEPQMGMGYHAWPEQTMDERYLETIPEVESLYSQYSRRSSVATTTLPELPLYVYTVLLTSMSVNRRN
jgi:hypothetical protein